jgi:hypothetical protein
VSGIGKDEKAIFLFSDDDDTFYNARFRLDDAIDKTSRDESCLQKAKEHTFLRF